jgi:2-keto-3-deoxy-L-rhamnonate aldolase RhmA
MSIKENKIRELLKAGKPITSTRIWGAWPFWTEVAGDSGSFDYIEFVGEYAPFTQFDLENICRAAELKDTGSMIKLDFQNRLYTAQKAAAAGFQAILFSDHHTADEVRESVFAMKPDCLGKGRFGYPNGRFIGTQSHISQNAHCRRVDDIVLAFMIEKKEAVDNIEEICSVPGVDMVQFGPSDYSMSLGKERNEMADELKAVEKHVIEVALKHGVTPRCEVPSFEGAQYYADLGVRCFSLGDQLAVLKKFWSGDGKKLRDFTATL